jgi:PTH1 family peptidyl-tRNA hydrolase
LNTNDEKAKDSFDGHDGHDGATINDTHVIVGLGNPGPAYTATRHNIGFKIVDSLSEHFKISLGTNRFQVVFGRGNMAEREVILAKPMAYMNRSGFPIRRLMYFSQISYKGMLVIHDDIDLVFGRLKIKVKGGHGGHNGIKSLIDVFEGGDFSRLRVGIGRPDPGISVVDHVLGRFKPNEITMLDEIKERARDAIVTILCKGAKEGMNLFN